MSIFHCLRLYHTALAILAILAYVSGEAGAIHRWLGYGVAGIIAFRLCWGIVGPRQIGISRLFPNIAELIRVRWLGHPAISKALLTGIVVSLLTVTVSGIMMDRPATSARQLLTSPAHADEDRDRHGDARRGHGKEDEFLEELHETAANLLLLCVGLHVAYLFAFKRKMALFMLFIETPKLPSA